MIASLRPTKAEDVKEALALCSTDGWKEGIDTFEVTMQEVERAAYSWTFVADGKIVCIVGVHTNTLLSNTAYLWMLTTEAAKEHQFLFVRYSKIMIERLKLHFDYIHGFVAADAVHSQRWLYWLGFKIGPRLKDNPKMKSFSMGEL